MKKLSDLLLLKNLSHEDIKNITNAVGDIETDETELIKFKNPKEIRSKLGLDGEQSRRLLSVINHYFR